MNEERPHLQYLADILDAMGKITQFIGNMTFEEFTNDSKTFYVVMRALEVIGEASKRIPQDIRTRYPDIPWREMAGM